MFCARFSTFLEEEKDNQEEQDQFKIGKGEITSTQIQRREN